jgi:hypothetical protein
LSPALAISSIGTTFGSASMNCAEHLQRGLLRLLVAFTEGDRSSIFASSAKICGTPILSNAGRYFPRL